MSIRLLFILPLLLLPHLAEADLYKWTDANGRVQFSDKQPEHHDKIEKINLPSAPTAASSNSDTSSPETPGASRDILERQKKINSVLQAEREQREAENRKIAEQKAQIKRRCIDLRDYKQRTENALLYKLDEKGERKFMAADEQENHLSRLEQEIKAACQ